MSEDFFETDAQTIEVINGIDSLDGMRPVLTQDTIDISNLLTRPLTEPAGPVDSPNPITPEIHLTPRQQRVLRYLARRRMRNASITRRTYSKYPDDNETPGSTHDSVPLTPAPVSN